MLLAKRLLTIVRDYSDEIRLERFKRPVAQYVGFDKREVEVSQFDSSNDAHNAVQGYVLR